MKSAVLVTIVFCLIGCSKNGSGDSDPGYFNGNLVTEVKTLYKNGRNLSQSCDVDLQSEKLELVTELQNRKQEIEQAKVQHGSNDNDPRIQAGLVSFRDNTDHKIGKDEWVTERYSSWKGILEFYRKVKSNPTIADWVRLDFSVREVLPDERKRLIKNHNMSLRYGDRSSLEKLTSEIRSCIDDSSCTSLNLSSSTMNWIQHKRFYFQDYHSVSEPSAKFRENINNYYDYIFDDLMHWFLPTHSKHEADASTSTLFVRMDMSIFGSEASTVKKWIENYWSRDNLQIKILSERKNGYAYYQFVMDPNRERAEVDSRKVFLPQYTSLKTLFHEMGHVFGLPDEYFTIWNEDRCGYIDEYNPSSIMSESKSGIIKDRHIREIRNLYFN